MDNSDLKIKAAKASVKHRPSDKSMANLHLFKKGQSGNPAGRPSIGKSIRETLAEYGKLKAPEEFIAKVQAFFPDMKNKKIDLKDAIYLRVMMSALQGESWALQFIAERTEGRVPQKLDIKEQTIIEVGFEDTAAPANPENDSEIINTE